MHFSKFFILQILFFAIQKIGSAMEDKGTYKVLNSANVPCIYLQSDISLYLTYETLKSKKDVTIHVPTSSKIDSDISSCDVTIRTAGMSVQSQQMRIKLDHMNGWFIDLAFTKDSRFRTENKIEYTVFQVNITANFSSDPAAFPDSKYPTQNYYLQVKPNLPSDIANAMQVSENRSYYCPSEQKYVVNSDKNVGPYAYILFKRTTMQAFMGSSILGSKETCSTDQHPIDFVTIIISSALSGLLALVLTVYLVYQHVFSKNVLISANSDSENKPNQEAMDESFSVHL